MKDRDEERNYDIVEQQQNSTRPQLFKGWILSSVRDKPLSTG